MKKAKYIFLCVKCSDTFNAQIMNEKSENIGDYDGYVPDFFPEHHYGDYVELKIDITTGKILNWNKPTQKQINELLNN